MSPSVIQLSRKSGGTGMQILIVVKLIISQITAPSVIIDEDVDKSWSVRSKLFFRNNGECISTTYIPPSSKYVWKTIKYLGARNGTPFKLGDG